MMRNVSGDDAAALLLSDYAVLPDGSTITIDTARAWAGAVWRIGDRALALVGRNRITAEEALHLGLCDDTRAAAWPPYSRTALDSAARLIRSRGGDALERAEFARLFAAGVPAEGLRAFLEKRRPEFEE